MPPATSNTTTISALEPASPCYHSLSSSLESHASLFGSNFLLLAMSYLGFAALFRQVIGKIKVTYSQRTIKSLAGVSLLSTMGFVLLNIKYPHLLVISSFAVFSLPVTTTMASLCISHNTSELITYTHAVLFIMFPQFPRLLQIKGDLQYASTCFLAIFVTVVLELLKHMICRLVKVYNRGLSGESLVLCVITVVVVVRVVLKPIYPDKVPSWSNIFTIIYEIFGLFSLFETSLDRLMEDRGLSFSLVTSVPVISAAFIFTSVYAIVSRRCDRGGDNLLTIPDLLFLALLPYVVAISAHHFSLQRPASIFRSDELLLDFEKPDEVLDSTKSHTYHHTRSPILTV